MTDRCILVVHDSPTPIATREWDQGEYTIGMAYEIYVRVMPIVWLSLFTRRGIKEVQAVSFFDDEDKPLPQIPTLHASISSAIKNYKRRRATIRRHTRKSLWVYMDLFFVSLSHSRRKFVQIDLQSFWAIKCYHDLDSVNHLIDKYLSIFSNEAIWSSLYGKGLIADTSILYGDQYLTTPFAGELELPWLNVEKNRTVKSAGTVGGRNAGGIYGGIVARKRKGDSK